MVSCILEDIPLNVIRLIFSNLKFYRNYGGMHLLFPFLITELCKRAGVVESSSDTWVSPKTPIYPLKIQGDGPLNKRKKGLSTWASRHVRSQSPIGHPMLGRLRILYWFMGYLRYFVRITLGDERAFHHPPFRCVPLELCEVSRGPNNVGNHHCQNQEGLLSIGRVSQRALGFP